MRSRLMHRIDAIAGAAVLLAFACTRPSAPAPRAPAPDAAAREAWSAGACVATGDGWCWGYPRPIGIKLNRLWGTSPSDVWAVGEGGTILHFDGARWSRVASGTNDSLVAIGGRGPGDAWAIGKGRTVLRLSGGAWRKVDLPKLENDEELADLLVLPNGEGWIVGGMTKKSVTGDELTSHCLVGHLDGTAAAAWKIDVDEGCGPLARVWGRTPDDVWADGGNIVHWNGRYLTLNPKEKPAPIVGRHGYASGWKVEGGSGPGALVDPRRPKASPGNVRDFWAWGLDEVWAILPSGALTHFDGQRWSRGDDPNELHAVAARAADDIWALTSDSSLLHDDGRDWRSTRPSGASGQYPVAIATPAVNEVWVLLTGELIHVEGKRWATVALGPERSFKSLAVRGPNDVWFASGTKLRHWNGRTVEVIDVDFNATLVVGDARELWVGWPLHRWDGSKLVIPPEAAGSDGKGLHFSGAAMGGGALWLVDRNRISRLAGGRLEVVKELEKQPKDPSIPVLDSIWVSPAGDIWAGGTHIIHGKGDTWTVSERPGPSNVVSVGGADGLVWALSRDGLLFRDVR